MIQHGRLQKYSCLPCSNFYLRSKTLFKNILGALETQFQKETKQNNDVPDCLRRITTYITMWNNWYVIFIGMKSLLYFNPYPANTESDQPLPPVLSRAVRPGSILLADQL